MKQYFGFRYFSSDKTTAGKPHKQSGNVSIAGECIVFNSKQQLEEWLNQENLSIPSDSGGGKRIKSSRADLRNKCLGLTMANFNRMLLRNTVTEDTEQPSTAATNKPV